MEKKIMKQLFLSAFWVFCLIACTVPASAAAKPEDIFVVKNQEWAMRLGDAEAPTPNGGQETKTGWIHWLFVDPETQDESKGLPRGILFYEEKSEKYSFLPLEEGHVNAVHFNPNGERFIVEGPGEMEMYDISLELYVLADMKMRFKTMKATMPPLWADSGRFVYSRSEPGTSRGRPDDYPDEWSSLVMYDATAGKETVLKAATKMSNFGLSSVSEDGSKVNVLEEYVSATKNWANPDKSKSREFSVPLPPTASGSRPVFVDGALVGVFENGKWSAGRGEVSLDGKILNWEEAENDEAFTKKVIAASEAGKNLPCEMSRLKKGQKVVYFTPKGKVGEGVVTGAYLTYEGEASGVGSYIGFKGYKLEGRKLVVGVAEGIDAVPAPVVRKSDGKGFTFYCDYKGTTYSATLTPQKLEDEDGDLIAGKLMMGKRSWDIEFSEEFDNAWWPDPSEELECGFFDLDGDGALELAVNAPGPNGKVFLFRIDAARGPEKIASVYTGNE